MLQYWQFIPTVSLVGRNVDAEEVLNLLQSRIPFERQFRTDERCHSLNPTTLETSDGVSLAALKNDPASAGKSRRALLLDPETTATAPDTPEPSGYRMGTMCLDRGESVEARFA
jgi:hypothetical protein